MNLEPIEHSELNQDFKGWPKGVGDKKISCIQDQGWNLLNGDLPLPVATLKQSVMENNSRWMQLFACLLYTSPSPRDGLLSRMPSSA